MAGTLQTLLLTPPSTGTVPLQRRSTYFPATHFVFSGDKSVNAKRKSLFPRKLRSIKIKPIRASEQSNQANGGEESPWAKPLLSFATNNLLPLALVSGVALGLANPTLGCLADKYSLSKFSTFGIFIISGLTLRSDEIGAATEAWPVGLFGLGSILLFTPFFSRFIVQLQLQPQEFVTGLAIFSCMPTTLSSGVALTRLAGGNSALALAMTLMSNLLGILIVPFSISKFVAAGVGITVPTKQLFRSLVVTLLVPVILGKVFRESFKGSADFVDRNSKLLSVTSAILLSLVEPMLPKSWFDAVRGMKSGMENVSFVIRSTIGVPWMQVSRSRSLLLMVKPAIFLVAVGMGILLHIVLLVFNALSIQSLSAVSGGSKSVFAKKQNATALLLVASQKTLPVMVAVVEQMHGAFGESGLLVLPCVAAHLNQIIFDSFLVSFWLQKEQSPGNTKAA